MLKLFLGFMLGISFSASAAVVAGSAGYLSGWDVEVNGETVCSSPYVWPASNVIECD